MIFLRATIRKEIKRGSKMTEKDKIESVSDFIKKVTEHTNTTTTGYDGVSHLKPRVFFEVKLKVIKQIYKPDFLEIQKLNLN